MESKDPILKLETEILNNNILQRDEIEDTKENYKRDINNRWLKAFSTPKINSRFKF